MASPSRRSVETLSGASPIREEGFTGVNVYGGFVQDEFIPELAGVLGRRTYRQMRENDSMIGAIFYALETLGTTVEWRVDKSEHGTEAEAEFLNEVLFQDDMQHSWNYFVKDTFSTLTYGWSMFEITYKIRRQGLGEQVKEDTSSLGLGEGVLKIRYPSSKFDDGKVGIKSIRLRPQDTLWQWHISKKGEVLGMTQLHPTTGDRALIPITKALHLVTRPNRGSPEGISCLRSAYRDWYQKRRIENIEMDGIDRDMTGLPVVSIPAGLLRKAASGDQQAKATVDIYKKIAQDIRLNQSSGIVKPSDVFESNDGVPSNSEKVRIELLASPGQRSIDTDLTIRRKDRGMARAFMADFMTLAGEARGNFALAQNQSSLFITGLTSWLDTVETEINRQVIPQLWKLNGFTSMPPTVKHGNIVPNDAEMLGDVMHKLIMAGAITLPDKELEDALRGAIGMPASPNEEEMKQMKLEQGKVDAEIQGMKAKASHIPGQDGKSGIPAKGSPSKGNRPDRSKGGPLVSGGPRGQSGRHGDRPAGRPSRPDAGRSAGPGGNPPKKADTRKPPR